MSMVLSDSMDSARPGDLLRKLSVRRLLEAFSSIRDEYRRDQHMIWSSYDQYSMTKNIPRRVWRRHSALFLVMPRDGSSGRR